MLRASDNIVKGFQDAIEKSLEYHSERLDEIRKLILTFNALRDIIDAGQKQKDSIVFWCLMESFRISAHSLYLCYCGLYRNVYDNIRHTLESMIQAYYIDSNHPSVSLATKLEILKEIEDKKEYHASRLIEEKIAFKSLDCKGLDCKGLLKIEYSELSRKVHPSHEKVMVTVKDVISDEFGMPVKINKGEIARIFELMKQMLDVLLFLAVANFPEWKTILNENAKLAKNIKKYNLRLLEAALRK
jgi:hypothetical protein